LALPAVLLFKRKANPSNTCPQCVRDGEDSLPSAVLGEVCAPATLSAHASMDDVAFPRVHSASDEGTK
jgi:hypothetical protein